MPRAYHDLLTRLGEDDGQTVMEYGLIGALISVAGVAVLGMIGVEVADLWTSVSSALP